ncbi:hypothetical protein QTI66_30030 [Variovorax sp. J22R133]|uniref:hypothetical protein n=1 Tax=Variovorax brevis TaxID=3053503 RepID=UPI0025771408|nr:hypothetical protein [Variovorax sp. J22R133]MDM0116392.1 hypothetical protein [Variovorax sp. J22R133]
MLGITGALYRTLRTTSPIGNLNDSIAHVMRNVKRWKDGQMTLRWSAGALSDAKGRFRKLCGHRDMKTLLAALQSQVRQGHRCTNARRHRITNENRHPAAFDMIRDIVIWRKFALWRAYCSDHSNYEWWFFLRVGGARRSGIHCDGRAGRETQFS